MRIVSRRACEKFLSLAQSKQKPSGSFSFDSTVVSVAAVPETYHAGPLDATYVVMSLHGNSIARARWTGMVLNRVEFTLAGWPTMTTKERLNGLLWCLSSGCQVYTENQQAYLSYRTRPDRDGECYSGRAILDAHKWYTIVRDRQVGYLLAFTSLDRQDQEHVRRSMSELVEA